MLLSPSPGEKSPRNLPHPSPPHSYRCHYLCLKCPLGLRKMERWFLEAWRVAEMPPVSWILGRENAQEYYIVVCLWKPWVNQNDIMPGTQSRSYRKQGWMGEDKLRGKQGPDHRKPYFPSSLGFTVKQEGKLQNLKLQIIHIYHRLTFNLNKKLVWQLRSVVLFYH